MTQLGGENGGHEKTLSLSAQLQYHVQQLTKVQKGLTELAEAIELEEQEKARNDN